MGCRGHRRSERPDVRRDGCEQWAGGRGGEGAREGRRARDPGLPQRRQGQGRRGAVGGAGGGAPPRPRRPGVRAGVRGLGRCGRRARQQRGRDGGAARSHGRRVRDAVRHQPSGAFRAHRPAAGQGHRSCRDDVEHHAQDRQYRPRRPELGTPNVPALAGLRAVQAREPAVHIRVAAQAVRVGFSGTRVGVASRLRRDEPAIAHRVDLEQGHGAGQSVHRAVGEDGRAADAVRRDRARRDRRQLPRSVVDVRDAGYPKVVSSNRKSHDRSVARQLWSASEQLTGVTYDFGG